MLIGLAGAAGSGKDTVARMLREDHSFATLAFADPLKCYIRDVWGLDDDVLWGPSEKRNTPLREGLMVWVCAPPRGCRWIGHGTDTARMDYKDMEPWDEPACPRCGLIRDGNMGFVRLPATARLALQTLGTEWGRALDPEVWVRLGIRRARETLRQNHPWGLSRGEVPQAASYVDPTTRVHWPPRNTLGTSRDAEPAGVAITDCRYKNEADAIREAGGHVIEVRRPAQRDIGGIAGHGSEAGIGEPDWMILNDGTLDDLRDKVAAAVEWTRGLQEQG